MSLNLFYSSAVEGDVSGLLGLAHYSYRFAEANFVRMFKNKRLHIKKLRMPEFYRTVDDLPGAHRSQGRRDIHLMFRSTEQFRLLKPARNISCFAWEFDVMKDSSDFDEHPFLNQVRMLTLCDEIWVPCTYTQNVLHKHGLERVRHIPAPLDIPRWPRPVVTDVQETFRNVPAVSMRHNPLRPAEREAELGRTASTLGSFLARTAQDGRKPTVFLSILNPDDWRKNLPVLIQSFHRFSTGTPGAVLLVKLVSSPQRTLEDVVAHTVIQRLSHYAPIRNDRMIFFSKYLSNTEMSELYDLADFYFGVPIAEGQNLPLLEAMAHGVVPVTTNVTAMLDYIDENNSIVVETRRTENTVPLLAASFAQKPYAIDIATEAAAVAALARAATMGPDEYAERSRRARATVERQFSEASVWARVATALNI